MPKVMVVDDSLSFRKSMVEILDILDLDIVEADDGKDALDKLKSESAVDLILLDFFMPNMDGMEFFNAIKDDSNYNQIPVVMITTAVDKDRMINAVRSGIKYYITKPFNPEDLLTKVVKILNLQM
jgi:two-component system chemotaxis response regulator CheY